MFSKPTLPVEIDFQPKDESGDNNDSLFNDDADDDPFNPKDMDNMSSDDCGGHWNSEKMIQHAATMFNIRKQIHKTAIINISKQQKKDKFYYDKKHSDPKV